MFSDFWPKSARIKNFYYIDPLQYTPLKNKNDLIFAIFGLLTLEMAVLGQNLGPCPRALVMDLGWIFSDGAADVC